MIVTEKMVTTERRETTTAPGRIITTKATDLGTVITTGTGRVTTVRGGRDGHTTDTVRDTRRDTRRDMTMVTGTGRYENIGLRETRGESMTEGKNTRR